MNLTRAISVERKERMPEWSRFKKGWEERNWKWNRSFPLSSEENGEPRYKAVTGEGEAENESRKDV